MPPPYATTAKYLDQVVTSSQRSGQLFFSPVSRNAALTESATSGNVSGMRLRHIRLASIAFGAVALTGSAAAAPARATRIELDVKLDPATGLMQQRSSITISGSRVSSLVFRLAEGLTVERCSTAEGVVEHREAGDDLVVDLDPAIDGTRTLSFLVSGRPRRGAKLLVGPDSVVLGPLDAWYPMLDDSWAETSVTVRVPPGWTAVAPGHPIAAREDGMQTWRSDRPVRTVAIAAAPGLELTETKVLAIPLRVAAPKSGPTPQLVAERLRDGMAWLSGALAPYPFDGFNVVFLEGGRSRVRAGGLAIVPASVPLETASDGADLLSGQWFGERVAGDGPWIEAWAAWQSTIFARDRALPLPSDIVRLRQGFFGLLSGDVPLARATATTPEEVLRGKGSAAPDMIRLFTDNAPFFAAIRSFFEDPVGPPLTLDRIRTTLEKHAERPLRRPFDDWFQGVGAPQIEASFRTFPAAGGGFRVDLTILQKRGTFLLPVEIVLYGPGEEHRETIEIDDVKTDLVYDLPFEPQRIEVDPVGKLFRWP